MRSHPLSLCALALCAAHAHAGDKAPAQFWGFEPNEGFNEGIVHQQQGWLGFFVPSIGAPTGVGALVQSQVVHTGAHALRIADEPESSGANLIGAVAPETGFRIPRGSLTVDTFMDDRGGADYSVVGQSLVENFLTFRVRFRFSGTIQVLSVTDGVLEYIDTGVQFALGEWKQLRVEFDFDNDELDYFYDDALIYEGAAFAGTSVDQVAFVTDGLQEFGEAVVGDAPAMYFDNITLIPAPGAAPIAAVSLLSLARRRRGGKRVS